MSWTTTPMLDEFLNSGFFVSFRDTDEYASFYSECREVNLDFDPTGNLCKPPLDFLRRGGDESPLWVYSKDGILRWCLKGVRAAISVRDSRVVPYSELVTTAIQEDSYQLFPTAELIDICFK